jgi:hypothetical protein
MSRHGYDDDNDGEAWGYIRWRGQVASAVRGKRGQKLLVDLLNALDAMPVKRLVAGELQNGSDVCAIGCVGLARGLPIAEIDPYDTNRLAQELNAAQPLIQEIEYMNDDGLRRVGINSPEDRWRAVREWVASKITKDKQS